MRIEHLGITSKGEQESTAEVKYTTRYEEVEKEPELYSTKRERKKNPHSFNREEVNAARGKGDVSACKSISTSHHQRIINNKIFPILYPSRRVQEEEQTDFRQTSQRWTLQINLDNPESHC